MPSAQTGIEGFGTEALFAGLGQSRIIVLGLGIKSIDTNINSRQSEIKQELDSGGY
ncbi:MAG TPA: hypothetical protein VJY62_02215 [Bacteroidia bacterium]|nr:hypothetical protein [Bacteroidia bacterium]